MRALLVEPILISPRGFGFEFLMPVRISTRISIRREIQIYVFRIFVYYMRNDSSLVYYIAENKRTRAICCVYNTKNIKSGQLFIKSEAILEKTLLSFFRPSTPTSLLCLAPLLSLGPSVYIYIRHPIVR